MNDIGPRIWDRPSSNIQFLSLQIGEWAKHTFPTDSGDHRGVLEHLKREIDEFFEAIENGDPIEDIHEEGADIVFLVTHFTHKTGGNMGEQLIRKFNINQRRKWGEPDEFGVVSHVDEEDAA